MTAGDRGREASKALTEIRTVLKRAETALDLLDGPRESHRLPKPPSPAGTADMGEPPEDRSRPAGYDPDITDMRAALDQVVALLSPWRKTGKTARWCTPVDEPPALDLDAIRDRYRRLEDLADSELTGTALAFAAGLAGNLSASDVPDLLEQVERLTAELAEARAGRGGQALPLSVGRVQSYCGRVDRPHTGHVWATQTGRWCPGDEVPGRPEPSPGVADLDRRHAGLGLPCDVCGPRCSIDD